MSGWKGRNPGQSWKSQENQWYQWLGLRKMTHDYPTLKTWFSQNSNRCAIQSWNTIFEKKTLPSREAGSMLVASFFGRVKTYFIYFSENYIAFAISRTEVRFLVILGKKCSNQGWWRTMLPCWPMEFLEFLTCQKCESRKSMENRDWRKIQSL